MEQNRALRQGKVEGWKWDRLMVQMLNWMASIKQLLQEKAITLGGPEVLIQRPVFRVNPSVNTTACLFLGGLNGSYHINKSWESSCTCEDSGQSLKQNVLKWKTDLSLSTWLVSLYSIKINMNTFDKQIEHPAMNEWTYKPVLYWICTTHKVKKVLSGKCRYISQSL